MTRLICELRNCMFYYIPEENRAVCVSNDSGIVDMTEENVGMLLEWCSVVKRIQTDKKWEAENMLRMKSELPTIEKV